MKREITVRVTTTPKRVHVETTILQDGFKIKSVGSTRLWAGHDAKGLDQLAFRMVAGACNSAVRAWMEQQELPF